MRILFLCKDNGARSQMAEALARQMFGAEIEVQSAGAERGVGVHPLAVACMREVNLDISGHKVKTVGSVNPSTLDLCVVVCEREVSVDLVPKGVKRLHWPLMDPLDPPAAEPELKRRFVDLRMALTKHLKTVGKLKATRIGA